MVTTTAALQVSVGTVDLVGVLLVVLGAYVFTRIASFAVMKVSERSVTHRITAKMTVPIIKAVVYSGVVYYVLGPLLSLTPSQLLAVSGLIGAAVGFGVKDLFSSLVGGLVIIAERPYKIGDTISFTDTTEFGPHYGEVTDIGIRATTIRTPEDTMVIVPNDAVFKTSVANANAGDPEMMVVIDFHIDSDADVERAKRIVEEALVTSRYVFLTEDRPALVLESEKPYYRTVRGKAYVNDTRNEFVFKSDVTRRVRREFAKEGIENPEPRSGFGEWTDSE